MAGDYDDAISRVDDLIATLHLNSICYVVQARGQRATTRRIPLKFPSGIYVSSPWKLAHEEWQLQGCDTIVRARTSPTATPHESSALDDLTGKLPKVYIANVSTLIPIDARYPDGNLIILALRFVSVFVTPCMPWVA